MPNYPESYVEISIKDGGFAEKFAVQVSDMHKHAENKELFNKLMEPSIEQIRHMLLKLHPMQPA